MENAGSWHDRLRDRWLWPIAWAFAVLTAFLAGATFWSVWTGRSEVPWRDQWVFLDDARQILRHDWQRLWYSYWGHRPVVARLVTLLNLEVFSGRNTSILILILTLQAIHAALLAWVAWRLFEEYSKAVFLIMAALIVQLSFSALQLENLIWAAQAGYILVWTSATAAFLLLAIYVNRQRPALLGASVLAAAISMLSSPNGVLVWPVLVLQAWLLRTNFRVKMLLVVAGAVADGIYLWHYDPGPPMGMGPLAALLHPGKSIPVLAMLTAGTVTSVSIRGATIVGFAALILAAYILVKFWRYHPPPLATVYGALAIFAILTLASVVARRISPEFIEERVKLNLLVIPSRYYTTVGFLWVGLAGISIWMAIRNSREWPQLVATGLMAAALTLGTVSWQISEAVSWRKFYRQIDVAGSALIMHVSVDPGNPSLTELYPDPVLRSDISAWLEKGRLALFTEERAALPGRHVVPGHTCQGQTEIAVQVGAGVFRLTGWTTAPVRDLVFSDDRGTIVGVARSGLRGTDLRNGATGWQGYARTTARTIHAYGVLNGSDHYCHIGAPVALPPQ